MERRIGPQRVSKRILNQVVDNSKRVSFIGWPDGSESSVERREVHTPRLVAVAEAAEEHGLVKVRA
jgi:hypothetical protein